MRFIATITIIKRTNATKAPPAIISNWFDVIPILSAIESMKLELLGLLGSDVGKSDSVDCAETLMISR